MTERNTRFRERQSKSLRTLPRGPRALSTLARYRSTAPVPDVITPGARYQSRRRPRRQFQRNTRPVAVPPVRPTMAKTFLGEKSTAKYCLELVRKHDYENYLCSLLLHKNIRRTGFAVRAFNIEVATIQDQISDTKIGQMRFKFWETSLMDIYKDKIPKHPVLVELYLATKTQNLSITYLKRLISSREKYMLNSSLKTMDDLDAYAENTVSPVYYLFLEAMGIKNMAVDHAVSHLGKCQGIVNIIRGVPRNARSGRISIPQDVLSKNGVTHENVLRNSSGQNVRDAVYEMASRANGHLTKARQLQSETDKRVRSICLPSVPLQTYLRELQKADFNVFDERLRERDGLLPARLLWHKTVR